MDGSHELPRYAISLANELQKVLLDIGKRSTSNEIKHNYAQRYSYRVIEWVNEEEKKLEEKKRKTRTGMIKCLVLIHKRAKQSYPRITWLMFQNIYLMYRNTNNKEKIILLCFSQACQNIRNPIN